MKDKNQGYLSKNRLAIIWVVIGVLGRLIPHVPNFTPLTSLSLFAGTKLSKLAAMLSLFLCLAISDLGLALIFGYPIFSVWSLFTYSGFAVMIYVGSKIKYSAKTLPIYLIASATGFWVWTNFGVWLTSNLYPKSLAGLMICFSAALPFLRNEIIGDLVWGMAIFGSYYYATKKIGKERIAERV